MNQNSPIFIRICEETGLPCLLEDHCNQVGEKRFLVAFGYLDHTCSTELLKKSRENNYC